MGTGNSKQKENISETRHNVETGLSSSVVSYNDNISKKDIKKNLKFEPFNKIMLDCHNEYRKKHSSQELNIEDKLCEKAKEYAKNLLETNFNCEQNLLYDGHIVGENIFISDKEEKGEDICKYWYEEKNNYDHEINKFQKGTNNYTQLIWSSTSKVGFGHFNKDKKYCYVALYYPAGNIFGQFTMNVHESLDKKI